MPIARTQTQNGEKIMIFKQLFDQATWTYTYLIADPLSKEALFIDPVNTHIDEYVELLEQQGLKLKYSLETHVHADHITASGLLRQRLGAQTAVSQLCGAESADIQIQEGEIFTLGENEKIKVITTPGHTKGSISFLWRDRVMSGDALLIDGCGRTDFQGGDAGVQYDSITQRLFTLPDDTLVYPGHDYQGRWVTNIAQERTSNKRLSTGISREQFIKLMENLYLPKPKLIDEAVPANRYCGLEEDEFQDALEHRNANKPETHKIYSPQDIVNNAKQQITEIAVDKAKQLIQEGNVRIIDTREESEYASSHIDNSNLLPRGVLEFKIAGIPELADKSAPVLIYCRTGGRSSLAALSLQQMGYTNVLSLAGGFEAWQKSNL
jgi:glyoxylase-like metal-dependent hydrolase (beta-lactamase superfamily II)/rhodanese-related sulfurtransferase